MAKRWTSEQEELLIKNYPVLPKAELAQLIPGLDVKSKAARMGLRKKGKLYSWKYEDEAKLIKLYDHTLNADLAKMLNKTESAVAAGAFKLRLKKTEAFMRFHSAKTWMKPGHVPFNKGKKQTDYMTDEAISKTESTRFKKGNVPHNAYEENGVISIRTDVRGVQYQWIRIELGEWVPLHVHNWEKEHGTIPDGCCVIFKDGDTMNCTLANLKCITRAENVINNSGPLNLPDGMVATYMARKNMQVDYELRSALLKHPSLIEVKRNQLLLNREIKKQNDKI